MAERCYIHGPTTTAGTCPTCDAMQSDAKDAEITRLRAEIETTNLAWGKTSIQLGWANARLAEARAAKADAWDQAMKAADETALRHISKIEINEPLWHNGQDWAAQRISDAICDLVNPYRSKTDANETDS